MTRTQYKTIETDIPARLDRLPWSKWHIRVLIGLGTVWILDGLEVTIVGNITARLSEPGSGISITDVQVAGTAAALYVLGACLGALFFGHLTDRWGRKRLFIITLVLYLTATALTGLTTEAWMFFILRFLTGAGIGGEYAAINSAIDELIPANYRGRINIIINGTFWVGAAGGALLSIIALDESLFPRDIGWRLTFFLGLVFGLVILLVRRTVPESPRWLFIHGREDEAEKIVREIETKVQKQTSKELPEVTETITIHQRPAIGFGLIAKTLFGRYPKRAVLGFSMFIGQAFIYNAITFGFATILATFYDVPSGSTGYYYAVLAVFNFLGPLLLSRFFDTWGRRPMISGTYILSGSFLLITAWVFNAGLLTAVTLTACWCATLFFASAGASSAYLTVSEVFPMETRAMAIAFFYAIGTAAGGISGPLVFANMVETGEPFDTAIAFSIGAVLMLIAGVIAIFLSVDAEKKSLEDIAAPISSETNSPEVSDAS
ncbi:MFS transporter [Enteractinococcus coprophilus]|uniref:Putative MFS family arabinose efflux permease n=1 Tax=Enteractinococcus coprophilus TaxID=1027633 RepID=A0A543AGF3_9MICC|nr:MFS transporter [Enteractinococcus coprophilus]TQL71637.1 putative MFS family arabinose efflux permease [Enteractinococcus coprophilus]